MSNQDLGSVFSEAGCIAYIQTLFQGLNDAQKITLLSNQIG
jgi:hypothetical protein